VKRITVQRRAIQEAFVQQDRPLGVAEILKYGNKVIASLNQATVYRNLKLLVESGWLIRVVHPVLGTLYEKAGKEHHHHFHCRACNRTLELPGCALRADELRPDGFMVEDHELFIFGICPSCGDSNAMTISGRRKAHRRS
jgi:Fur family transcriptional regulator, ferric uptake regulator